MAQESPFLIEGRPKMALKGVEVCRRPGESVDRLITRFNRRVEREGVMRDLARHWRFLPARTRRFKRRIRAQRLRERANRAKR